MMKGQELPKFPKSIVEDQSTRLFRMNRKEGQVVTKIPESCIRFNVDFDSIKTNYRATNEQEKHSMSEEPKYNLYLYSGAFGIVTDVTKKQIQAMLSMIEQAESMAGKNISLE